MTTIKAKTVEVDQEGFERALKPIRMRYYNIKQNYN